MIQNSFLNLIIYFLMFLLRFFFIKVKNDIERYKKILLKKILFNDQKKEYVHKYLILNKVATVV